MKPTLKSGLSFTLRISIDATRTISFMGEDGRVYSTPSMVRDMEQTSRDLLLQHLEPGEDSVGVRIEVSHLAAAPINDHVDITSTITEIDRRRVTFSVSVRDPIEEIGRGVHTRFIGRTEESKRRIADKIARLSALTKP